MATETTKTIRAMKRADAEEVPIIAMTADAFTDDINRCLKAGMNGHVAKPINPKYWKKELSKAIANRYLTCDGTLK